jgi:hypothetical protein
MTPQEIFNKAYLGLKVQGGRSLCSKGDCAYNGKNGTHCGVGFLVSPEVAAEWDTKEPSDIETLVLWDHDGVEPWMKENLRLLEDLQMAHDMCYDWTKFETVFANLAARFNLEVPA